MKPNTKKEIEGKEERKCCHSWEGIAWRPETQKCSKCGISWREIYPQKEKENLSYQVILTAKDGRFGTKILEGGLNKKTALFEAKKLKELGIVIRVFDKQNKQFIL